MINIQTRCVLFFVFFFVKTLWTIFIFFKIPFCLISNCKCFHICTKFNFIFIAFTMLWKHQPTSGWQYGQYVTKSRTASSKAPRAVPLTAETSLKTILIYFGFVLVRGGETPSLFITAADRWRLYHVMLGNFSVAKHLLWWHVMKCDDIFEFKLTMQVKITHHASSNEGNTTNCMTASNVTAKCSMAKVVVACEIINNIIIW